MLIPGRCHCGNISFTLNWTPGPAGIPARACGCSFCTKHGAVWTTSPAAELRVRVTEPALVSRYAFATETAEFHICTRCGVVPLVTSRIAGRLYAVVNVHALEGLDPALLRHAAVDFDGEDVASRLARRQRHWIGDVEYAEGGG
ncbi:MAG TPA: hypothetical protein VF096_07195 [Azonexus sp.]